MANRLAAILLSLAVAGAAHAGPSVVRLPVFISRTNVDGQPGFVVVRSEDAVTFPGGQPTFAGFFYNPFDPWWGTWYATRYGGGFLSGRLYVRLTTFEGNPIGRQRSGLDRRMVEALVREDPSQDPPIVAIRQGRLGLAAELLIERATQRADIEASRGVGLSNRRALRLAAVVLAAAGAVEPAAELCWTALREDPLLWREPVDGVSLIGNARIRAAMGRASKQAELVESVPAWTLAATLAQAAGEHDLARRYVSYAAALAGDGAW